MATELPDGTVLSGTNRNAALLEKLVTPIQRHDRIAVYCRNLARIKAALRSGHHARNIAARVVNRQTKSKKVPSDPSELALAADNTGRSERRTA